MLPARRLLLLQTALLRSRRIVRLAFSRAADAARQGAPAMMPPTSRCCRRRSRRGSGAPLRVLFTAEKPLDGELSLIAPDGSVAARSRDRHGGPPYFWFAEVKAPAAGNWRATLSRTRAGRLRHRSRARSPCAPSAPPKPGSVAGSVWPLRNHGIARPKICSRPGSRSCSTIPIDAAPSWPALHVVLRDRSRNILFNHLGLGEDEMKMVLRPDCADLPYFLRAYFAFKMGLPFGFSKCTRGGGGRAPSCPQWFSIQNADAARPAPTQPLPPPGTPASAAAPARAGADAAAWSWRQRSAISCQAVGDSVHSGSARAR